MGSDTEPRTTADLEGTHYRAYGVMGEGGMAVVFDAEDLRDRRRVVVKMLRPDAAQSPELVARLRVEATALKELRHPNLVEVSDWGLTPGGHPFVVMERLSGRDLRAELRARGALARDLAVELARQALAGLEALHRRGIIHRDVKPGNLFLCDHADGGQVLKVLDLGIAKITAEARMAALSTRLQTAPGEILGTPKYVAPEVLMGGPVTPAADVYAMGLVLYEMLTGRYPFAGRGLEQLWEAHLLEVPLAPSAVAQAPFPAALDRVVMRALAKQPGERFADATEMGAALARAATALAAGGDGGLARDLDTAPSMAPATAATRRDPVAAGSAVTAAAQPSATLASPSPAVAATLPSPTWARPAPDYPPVAQAPAPSYGAYFAAPSPPAAPSSRHRGRITACLVLAVCGLIWHSLNAIRGLFGVIDPAWLYSTDLANGVPRDLIERLRFLDPARDSVLTVVALGLCVAAARRRGDSWPSARWGWIPAALGIAMALVTDILAIPARVVRMEKLPLPPPGSLAVATAIGMTVAAVAVQIALVVGVFGKQRGRDVA